MLRNLRITVCFIITFTFIIAGSTIKADAMPIIDFEGLSAGDVIFDEFKDTHGVIFTSTSTTLKIWEKGNTYPTYFDGAGGPNITVDPVQTGDFYLGTDPVPGARQIFILNYINPVDTAYGDILDLEGGERATFYAYDSTDNLLDEFTKAPGSGGNGSIRRWEFNRPSADISKVVINAKWVALDNISGSASPVPEPSTWLLLSFGLFGLAGINGVKINGVRSFIIRFLMNC